MLVLWIVFIIFNWLFNRLNHMSALGVPKALDVLPVDYSWWCMCCILFLGRFLVILFWKFPDLFLDSREKIECYRNKIGLVIYNSGEQTDDWENEIMCALVEPAMALCGSWKVRTAPARLRRFGHLARCLREQRRWVNCVRTCPDFN